MVGQSSEARSKASRTQSRPDPTHRHRPQAPAAGARLRCKEYLQMGRNVRTALNVTGLFLLAQFAVVQCFGPASPAHAQRSPEKSSSAKKRQPAAPEVRYGSDRLPGPVQDMRDAILSAVRAGRK